MDPTDGGNCLPIPHDGVSWGTPYYCGGKKVYPDRQFSVATRAELFIISSLFQSVIVHSISSQNLNK